MRYQYSRRRIAPFLDAAPLSSRAERSFAFEITIQVDQGQYRDKGGEKEKERVKEIDRIYIVAIRILVGCLFSLLLTARERNVNLCR